MGNSSCLPRGKPAVTKWRYPTNGACWVFQCFHNPPNSDMDYGIFNVCTDVSVYDCARGVYGHRKRVCAESRLWEKNLLPYRGIEPASAACRSNALPTELHPHPFEDICILITQKRTQSVYCTQLYSKKTLSPQLLLKCFVFRVFYFNRLNC